MIKDIDVTKAPTQEQLNMLQRAQEKLIPEDAEHSEFSDNELSEFKRATGVLKENANV